MALLEITSRQQALDVIRKRAAQRLPVSQRRLAGRSCMATLATFCRSDFLAQMAYRVRFLAFDYFHL
jgi:hypothetical protein